jgi:hypothetical protein
VGNKDIPKTESEDHMNAYIADICRILYMNGYSFYDIMRTITQNLGLSITHRSLLDALALRTFPDAGVPPGYVCFLDAPDDEISLGTPDLDEICAMIHQLYTGLPRNDCFLDMSNGRGAIKDLSLLPDSAHVAANVLANSSHGVEDGEQAGYWQDITVWYSKNGHTAIQNYLLHEKRTNREAEVLPEW